MDEHIPRGYELFLDQHPRATGERRGRHHDHFGIDAQGLSHLRGYELGDPGQILGRGDPEPPAVRPPRAFEQRPRLRRIGAARGRARNDPVAPGGRHRHEWSRVPAKHIIDQAVAVDRPVDRLPDPQVTQRGIVRLVGVEDAYHEPVGVDRDQLSVV